MVAAPLSNSWQQVWLSFGFDRRKPRLRVTLDIQSNVRTELNLSANIKYPEISQRMDSSWRRVVLLFRYRIYSACSVWFVYFARNCTMRVSLILQNKYNRLLKKKYQYDATVNARCYFIFFKSESSTVISSPFWIINQMSWIRQILFPHIFPQFHSPCFILPFFSEAPWFNTIIVWLI